MRDIFRRFPKGKRGVSPLIATLILIAATVAGGAIVYSVMQGQASKFSGGAELEITYADVIVSGNTELATVTVRNMGSTSLNSVTATVTTDTAGAPASISIGNLSPGQAISGSDNSGAWTAGKTYIVQATGTAPDGSVVSKSQSVLARS